MSQKVFYLDQLFRAYRTYTTYSFIGF